MELPLRRDIARALVDYKFLLNRGYPQKPSLDFVTSRYGLSRLERALLLRCIHSDEDVAEITSKKVDASEVWRYVLVVDGFNALLTVTSVIEGDYVYMCDDGLVRDLRSGRPRELEEAVLKEAIGIIVRYLSILKPTNVTFILDKNVSKSAEFKEVIQSLVKEATVVLASKADIAVISSNTLVSSSDFVILKRAHRVFDLAGYVVVSEFMNRVVDVRTLLRDEVKILKFNIN